MDDLTASSSSSSCLVYSLGISNDITFEKSMTQLG